MTHLNANLMQKATELEVVNQELEAFSYSVSHDLRAPLRSINGFAQALKEDYEQQLNKEGKDYLRRIQQASHRMGELIDDLLKLSRLTQAEMQIDEVNLSQHAQQVIEHLRSNNPDRKITIDIEKNIIVKGDEKLLHILIQNLIENAWKFTKNTPNPTIQFGTMKQNNQTVYFIKDSGAGFNMKYINRLFTPFQRLHDNKEYPGTGIGLGIVKRVIHRHSGRIWAESKEGKGATFYFTLGGK
jgi:light-regulated signal transduction histidine kinase (bacteriophytochrome)